MKENELRRVHNRTYYVKNRHILIAKSALNDKRRKEAGYEKPKEDKAYHQARIELRQACRPDVKRITYFKHRYPTAPVSHLRLSPEEIDRRERIYAEKLATLRILYNRDPRTGRKIPPDGPIHPLIDTDITYHWGDQIETGRVVFVEKDSWCLVIRDNGKGSLWMPKRSIIS